MQTRGQSLRPAWHVWVVALALAIVVWITFLPVARLPFISLDDADYVTDNPHVRAGLTWSGIKWAFKTFHACNWHPLTWLSHMVDMTLFGPGPRGPHGVNLALHVANAVLVLLLLRRLTGSLWRSAGVAALFALHPLRVESVSWVSERKDVLSAFFFLLTLYSYAHYTKKSQRRTVWYVVTLALSALGLLSKPMLVTLPCVLLLLDVWPLGRTVFLKPLLREKLPFFALSAASCVATYHAQNQGGAVRAFTSLSFFQRLENACVAYLQYLGLTFRPVDLAIYYPQPSQWTVTTPLIALVCLIAVTVFAVKQAQAKPFVALGWFWFTGMLIPVIGLIQVGSQSMADRYTYLPSIGLLILFVWGIAELLAKDKLSQTCLSLVVVSAVIALGFLTRAQLRHWHNSETLFRHTLAVTRNNFVAHYNLGSSLLHSARVDEAIEQFEKTLAIHPRYAEAHVDFGNALLLKQRPQDAIAHYQQAIQLQPHLGHAHYNLGTTLLQLGRLDEAVAALNQAAALQTESALPALNLGNAYLQKNDFQTAIASYEKALALQPDLADAHSNLGFVLAQINRADEARAHLENALKLNPRHANAHFHLGNLLLQQNLPADAALHFEQALAAAPHDIDALNALAVARLQQGDFAAAIVHFETALRLQPANPRMQANLALALRQGGREAEAAEVANRALALAIATGDTTLAEALRQQFPPK
ncbi:MAG: tetratricopeptide repeat protein [Nibricoccus sp.]